MLRGAPLRDALIRRDQALRSLRALFAARGFVEVDTPMLVEGPGLEPHIDPLSVVVRSGFEASGGATRYLHTSPELALKRILGETAGTGLDRVFQVARVFRDGERGPLHRPEFTMVEWYRRGGTLLDIIGDLEALASELGGPKLRPPFARATVAELFSEHAGVDLLAALSEHADGNRDALPQRVRAAGHSLRAGADFDDAFFHVMASRVEPAIATGPPMIVERWPASMAVLARLCDDDPRLAHRFELYAGGVELCNAFDELTDADEQRRRFEADNAHRAALGKPQLPLDERFLAALPAMGPAAGVALGFDRFLLVAAGVEDLGEVLGIDVP